MTSRRPPLNLSEPKSKGAMRGLRGKTAAPKAETTAPEPTTPAEFEAGVEAGVEDRLSPDMAAENNGADDILNAPLTTEAAPPPAPDPLRHQPDAPLPDNGLRDASLDSWVGRYRPEPAPPLEFTPITPPPETTPPVMTAPAPETSSRTDLRPLTFEPEGVMKATGSSPFLFWGTTTFISLLWAAGLGAFAIGAQHDLTAFSFEPFRAVILAFLALFPIGLIFASAFALRNAAALTRQAERTAAMADAMLAPATAATNQAGDLVAALREQVDLAVRAVQVAHSDISELSTRLKQETDRLNDAAHAARTTTLSITRSLEHERTAIGVMSDSLSQQSGQIIEAVDRQARMVADASDLAQTQLREAEVMLTASATRMVTSAVDAANTARNAGEDMDRQAQRLETAGSGVADQIRSVEEGLSQQRSALVSTALSLRADQEDFAIHIENQRAQLTEALSITRVATVDLGETSARGIDVLRDIVVSAQTHFHSVHASADEERAAFEARITDTFAQIAAMAAQARDELVVETQRAVEHLNITATDARRAADVAAQTAQLRVDRLNESIFEAGKKADEVFESRFNAVRRLIETSAELINEAGDYTTERLDASFAHSRQTIDEVHRALAELNQSAETLPLMAQERLRDIRRSVEEGLVAMTEASKKAALETEAVDQAFQARVKRNYDMLAEAVSRMGVQTPAPAAAPRPASRVDARLDERANNERPGERLSERLSDRMNDSLRESAGRTAFGARREGSILPPSSLQAPPPAPAQPVERDRLRLSPDLNASRPAASHSAGSPPASNPATNKDGLSWRDLLNDMESRDGTDPEHGDEPIESLSDLAAQIAGHSDAPQPPPDAEFDNLDDLMINEITALGVDAAAVLSRSRLEEIMTAFAGGETDEVRQLVQRVAPAAIRRLSRRLVSDHTLRQQANDFATYYDRQVHMALMSKDVLAGLSDILANESGRAYLLIDAALSDAE